MLNNLSSYMSTEKVDAPLLFKLDGCQIRPDPMGMVLIIGAWNYPIQLTLLPLVGAIAAGNAAIVKPSELSEHTAQLLADLFPRYLDPECYKIVNGGIPESTCLLEERFDKILTRVMVWWLRSSSPRLPNT